MFKSLKNTFQKEQLGTVITTLLVQSGGVTYKPMMSKAEATEVVGRSHYAFTRKRTVVAWRLFILIRFSWQPYFIE